MIVALDVDRTLLDSTAFFNVICEQSLQKYDSSEIIQRVIHQEQVTRGKRFDYISVLDAEGVLPPREMMQGYMKKLLYKGVDTLINNLEKSNTTYVLLTYGSVIAQTYKVKLIESSLGHRLPFHITNESNKAAWLERTERDGLFCIPIDGTARSVKAPSLILVDDKRANLETEHDRIHPILVRNGIDESAHEAIAIDKVWDEIVWVINRR